AAQAPVTAEPDVRDRAAPSGDAQVHHTVAVDVEDARLDRGAGRRELQPLIGDARGTTFEQRDGPVVDHAHDEVVDPVAGRVTDHRLPGLTVEVDRARHHEGAGRAVLDHVDRAARDVR